VGADLVRRSTGTQEGRDETVLGKGEATVEPKEIMKPRKCTEQQVKDWNEKHPVGSECMIKLDSGQFYVTKTRTPAWLLPFGAAVVSVEGRSGGYAVERVHFLEESK